MQPTKEQIENLKKMYILSRALDFYGQQFQKAYPDNYLNNKNRDITKSCEAFYRAFDKKFQTKQELEEAIDTSMEYTDIINSIFEMPLEQLETLTELIKAIKSGDLVVENK